MQELLHAHWSVLATVCLICCCAFLLNDALFFHLMQSQLWKLNIGKRVTVNFRETSTDEPQILTQLHSDDQCTIMHKSLIWCIMTFVSLFQTLHFIPDRATDGYSNSLAFCWNFLGDTQILLLWLLPTFLLLCIWETSNYLVVVVNLLSTLCVQNVIHCTTSKIVLKRVLALYSVKTCSSSIFGKICGTKLTKEVLSRNGNRIKVLPIQSLYQSNFFPKEDTFKARISRHLWK